MVREGTAVRGRAHPTRGFTLGDLAALCVVGVLVILVVMLFFPSRHPSRRPGCASNLNEIGRAIENYLGMYDTYYPGKACWGYEWTLRGRGTLRASAGKRGTIFDYAGNGRNGDSRSDMRAIGTGWTDPMTTAEGALKVAPIGLGLLLDTGTLYDSRALYCPSAKDQHMDCEIDARAHHYNPNDSPTDWKAAGGFDAEVLTHGKWHKRGRNAPHMISVFSTYDYRNQPGWDYSSDAMLGPSLARARISVAFTVPKVRSDAGCPAFKTPRLLGGRALVMDSFAKGADTEIPGFGAGVHKEGYNVLSGDYSTRWYGDMDGRIAGWNMDYPGSDGIRAAGLFHSDGYWAGRFFDSPNELNPQPRAPGYRQSNMAIGCRTKGVPLVWHTVDVWMGIDVNVADGDDVDSLQ